MRRTLKIISWTLLSAAIIAVCIVRWQAWFGMPDEPRWTGDTITFHMPTFADDSVPGFVRFDSGWQDRQTPATLNILLLGDIHSQLRQADYDSLAKRVPGAEMIVQTGDWMDRGQEYYHQLLLREWRGSGLSGLPVVVCPGNHEYSKGLVKRLSPVWQKTFGESNYWVDYPNMRLIVMDTNPLDRLVHVTRTLTWLRQAMYTADGRFIVVVMHHPVLPAAKGRFYPLIYGAFRYALGEADLVIAGHDHLYQRRMPFVSLNSAGKPKQPQQWIACECATDEPVYAVLTVRASQLCLRTYRMRDGQLIDRVYVKHD